LNRTIAAVALFLLPGLTSHSADLVRDAVVKVYATRLDPMHFTPWAPGNAASATGSGFVISARRILTNAHIVSNHTFVEVRRHGQDERHQAQVLHIHHDADLAVLTVARESFWEGLAPLDIGPLPELQQEVLVHGYPVGGDTLSVTRGVVSRIEHWAYLHSGRSLLAGQIDAAINPGNSGGPVVLNGKVVGVAMQALQAQSVAYMVPSPVIDRVLEDLVDGKIDGIPSLGVRWQPVENAGLRQKYGLPPDRTGVLVQWVTPGGSSQGYLQRGDVLLGIEGHPISGSGTVEFRPHERTRLEWYVDEARKGSAITIEVLREGRVRSLQIRLESTRWAESLLSPLVPGAVPSYFVFGGLVFGPLSLDYLRAWGPEWYRNAPSELLALVSEPPGPEGEQVVVLQRVLASGANEGYHSISDEIVSTVNGVKPRNLSHLVTLVEGGVGQSVTFQVGAQGLREVTLDLSQARKEHSQILQRYQVPADRSADLGAATARPAGGP
jgi:S1-C subfamily serine protease